MGLKDSIYLSIYRFLPIQHKNAIINYFNLNIPLKIQQLNNFPRKLHTYMQNFSNVLPFIKRPLEEVIGVWNASGKSVHLLMKPCLNRNLILVSGLKSFSDLQLPHRKTSQCLVSCLNEIAFLDCPALFRLTHQQ